MSKLDEIILSNVKQQLLTPDRLKLILEALIERRSVKDQAIADRKTNLDASLNQVNDKSGRLYKAIEEGMIELDQDLKDRVAALKTRKHSSRPAWID